MRSRLLALALCLIGVQCSSSSTDSPGTGTAPPVVSSAARLIRDCGTVGESVALDADLATSNPSCLTVKGDNLTIDGGGHRITAAQFAIQWIDHSGITVKNVVSGQGLQIFGGQASHNTVTDSTFGFVSIFRGDDNVVQSSRIGKLAIAGQNNDPAQRAVVRDNVFEVTLTQHEEKVVELITGTDGSLESDGTFRCARGEHLVMNNRITGTVASADPTTEPELLYVRCGTNSTISGNTIRSGQRAAGILLRDGADDNLVENNDVSIGEGNEGALFIQSGSAGFHHPRGNTFRANVFRAERGRSFWLQAGATRGNAFLQNLFRSDDAAAEAVRLADGAGVDTLFDHNTFYRGGTGTLIVFSDLGPGTNRFTSNIFAHGGGPRGIFDFDHLQSLAGYRADDNVFFNRNGGVRFGLAGDTLCEWEARTSQDRQSTEGDPRFVNPSAGDFHIDGDSAAHCAGENGGDAGALPSAGGASCPTRSACPP